MKKLIYIIFALSPFNLLSQQRCPPIENYKIHISKNNSGEIKIDGELNDPIWQKTERAKDFYQVYPFDSCYSHTKTEVMLTYDEKFIYLAAICHDSLKGDYVIQSYKRDFSYPVSDAFVVVFDPFKDKNNGFAFTLNPLGVQREGLISNGGNFGVTTDWDNKWYSECKRGNNCWTLEMAIPFKSLRFRENLKTWGINFGRNDLKRNESSTWVPVPRIFNIASLNFTGELIWDEAPKKTGHNYSIIPYFTSGTSRNFSSENKNQFVKDIGLDAKVAVSSSLNLDLTVNPDFSQVEADRQQVNLTRFSLFYPEKRLFFKENSDLFDNFGFRQIRPFFSRRIGLYQSPKTLQLQNIPIYFGARLSGKIDKNWRIGLMDVQTGSDSALKINGQNYIVAACQRQIFKTSNIAFISVNRERTSNKFSGDTSYSRIIGADFNLLSPNNKWKGKFFYHRSFSPLYNWTDNSVAHASYLNYSIPKFYFSWNHEYVAKNYNAEAGFVPHINFYNTKDSTQFRLSYFRLEPEIGKRYYPKSKLINNIAYEMYGDIYFTPGHGLTDRLIQQNNTITFQSSASLYIELNNYYTKLIVPSNISGINLGSGIYNYNNFSFNFLSNRRKKLNYNIGGNFGNFYDMKRMSVSGEISYRIQPYGILSAFFSYDSLYNEKHHAKILLIGPKADLSFSRSLFLFSFLQYNTQTSGVSVNNRIQWRFKPMSDLYFVFNGFYDSKFNIKNYVAVMKFVYWITL